ncbi:MAG: nitroreductase [Paraglaciecola sp.]|jgi:nitroreductase
MDALELLLTRSSQPRLHAPAPNPEELENIMQSALRAPDHLGLTPWRFVVCQKKGLAKLGDIFEQAAIAADLSLVEIERAPQLPLRAPMIIVAIAKFQEHAKFPGLNR